VWKVYSRVHFIPEGLTTCTQCVLYFQAIPLPAEPRLRNRLSFDFLHSSDEYSCSVRVLFLINILLRPHMKSNTLFHARISESPRSEDNREGTNMAEIGSSNLHIVDFISVGREVIITIYTNVNTADTRFAPNILGRGCFISLWRPVRKASALSGSLIRCLAPECARCYSQKYASSPMSGAFLTSQTASAHVYLILHLARRVGPKYLLGRDCENLHQ